MFDALKLNHDGHIIIVDKTRWWNEMRSELRYLHAGEHGYATMFNAFLRLTKRFDYSLFAAAGCLETILYKQLLDYIFRWR